VVPNAIPVTWPLQEPVIVEERVQAMSLEDINISDLKHRLERQDWSVD
jgi:hypothetical protein